ncbi:hypothetical protein [Ralstonia condita]|uniref:hypothetical protein n=1 Tax=Ralstonia condita TaxID=3058600 RepID=UPI0029319FB8|nr:hypothetical protein [Ralstonia sp. LMG 7141]
MSLPLGGMARDDDARRIAADSRVPADMLDAAREGSEARRQQGADALAPPDSNAHADPAPGTRHPAPGRKACVNPQEDRSAQP